MTLLKVLYFAHAWHLGKYKLPLIAQPFEAWKYGPVSRVVYDQFKGLGNKPINKKAVSFDIESVSYCDTKYEFDLETMSFLDNIFDYYSRYHPFQLSDLTHEKGAPWDIVWSRAEQEAVPGMIIPNELIASWFNERGALYWTNHEQGNVT